MGRLGMMGAVGGSGFVVVLLTKRVAWLLQLGDVVLTGFRVGQKLRAPGKNQEKKLILFRQNSSIAAQADF